MPTTTTYRTDRHGFPITECRRCGGTGHYSYNTMHGSTCYGCSGGKWVHVAPREYAAWRDAVRAAVRVLTQHLEPGDVVRPWGSREADGTPTPGRTVAERVATTEQCGYSASGVEGTPGYSRTDYFWQLVTWSTGETERIGSNVVWHREGVRVDPAPYVERAVAYAARRRRR